MASIKGAIEQQLGTTTEAPVVFPSPNASQSATLLNALGAIEPGLNRDRSIDRSRNSCKDIKDGISHAQVVSRTKYRFEGGTVPNLSDRQVEQIIVAITSSFCR